MQYTGIGHRGGVFHLRGITVQNDIDYTVFALIICGIYIQKITWHTMKIVWVHEELHPTANYWSHEIGGYMHFLKIFLCHIANYIRGVKQDHELFGPIRYFIVAANSGTYSATIIHSLHSCGCTVHAHTALKGY